MRKALAAFVLLTFAFSAAAIAQDSGNNTGETQNLCEGVTCSESSVTCADGYAAKCSNSCDSATGSCSQCTPSCSGHDKTFCETAQCGSSEKTCPDGFKATCTKTCDNAAKQCNECEPSCSGHDAVTQPTNGTTTCPTAPTPPACEQGKYLETKYDDKKCITGYECKASTSTTCPTPPPEPACPQDAPVRLEKKTDANGCVTGYECRTETTSTTCPAPPPERDCGNNVMKKNIDSRGCLIDYYCEPRERSCPSPPPFPKCNGRVETRHDNSGCAIGYECRPESSINDVRGAKWQCHDGSTNGESGECRPAEKWKQMAEDACRDKCNEDKSKCGVNSFSLGERCGAGGCGNNICEGGEERSCQQDCEVTTGPRSCGDTICDAGEDANSCPSDCKVPGRTCPVNVQCSDGSQVVCKQDGNSCQCGQCPIGNLPQGCRQEKDDKGFVVVRCEDKTECREISQEERVACTEKGGVPRFSRDGSGCKKFECNFGGGGENIFTPEPSQQCPTRQEWEMTSKKCASLGKITVTKIDRGCNIPTCIDRREDMCGLVSGPEREKIEQECSQRGARVVNSMDEKGCQKISCVDENTCQKDLPPEAYSACGAKGGEIAVKKDQNGCIIFSDCLRKGNIQESYVEEASGTLDTAELLQVALKLERLKVELDKLARETKDIAEYYKNTGSNEAERFERVSGMFGAATQKIDDIKNKIRSQADSISADGMTEIRRDIKYIKDVMIKDILYMMLSNGDDVKKIKEKSSTECSDDQCFGEALRLCKPMKFYPEDEDGPEVTITGLEDGKCIMKARLDDDKGPPAGVVAGGPPWEMTCRIENYALGMRNPEEDIFPYCQGSMVELIKKFGTGGSGGAPGVAGKCSGDGCKEYCGRGPAEAKECLEQLGPYLPEEAKQGLQMIAEGKSFQGFGGGGEFSDSDQYRRDQFSEDYNPENDYNPGFRQEEGAGPEFPPGQQFSQPSIRPSQPVQIQPREFRQPQANQQQAACVGCLNNGVCDPNECSGCQDCMQTF